MDVLVKKNLGEKKFGGEEFAPLIDKRSQSDSPHRNSWTIEVWYKTAFYMLEKNTTGCEAQVSLG